MKDQNNTKCLLIREATKQFSLEGFAKSSIRSICKKVNVSIASINYHFGNKENLIQAVVNNAIARFFEIIKNAELDSPNDLAKFLTFYAKEINLLESEVLLIFREMFQNNADSYTLDETVNALQLTFYQTADKVLDRDPKYTQIESFNERINIFTSLIILEAIKKSLLPTHIQRENYSDWVKNNLNIIFPLS